MSATSTEVSIPNASSFYRDADLAAIDSFQSVLDSFNSLGLTPESMSDYGTGFEICKNKDRLVDTDLVIVEWRFNVSEVGSEGAFVSAAVVTRNGEKWILNDGGTGIYQQLRLVTDQRNRAGHAHPQAALLVKGGLTKSEYMYQDEKGKQIPASTYYLNSAASN